jgi:hypothetical protein
MLLGIILQKGIHFLRDNLKDLLRIGLGIGLEVVRVALQLLLFCSDSLLAVGLLGIAQLVRCGLQLLLEIDDLVVERLELRFARRVFGLQRGKLFLCFSRLQHRRIEAYRHHAGHGWGSRRCLRHGSYRGHSNQKNCNQIEPLHLFLHWVLALQC